MNSEIINIIGSGSMGHLWAGYLSKSQFKINIVTRHNNGLQKVLLEAPDYSFFFEASYQTFDRWQISGLIIICVKATSLDETCKQLATISDEHPPIILMMNGMGLTEIAKRHLPNTDVYQASITHGAIFKQNNSNEQAILQHTGYGKTLIGATKPENSPLENQSTIFTLISELNRALPKTEWNINHHQALWTKLIINAVINPLTAIHGVKNGEILNCYEINQQAKDLTQQLSPLIEINLPTETWQSIWEKIASVAQQTSENFSSMYQDILNKQSTEIDFISGYLVNEGLKHGYQLEGHRNLVKEIKKLENEFCNSVTNQDPSSE